MEQNPGASGALTDRTFAVYHCRCPRALRGCTSSIVKVRKSSNRRRQHSRVVDGDFFTSYGRQSQPKHLRLLKTRNSQQTHASQKP